MALNRHSSLIRRLIGLSDSDLSSRDITTDTESLTYGNAKKLSQHENADVRLQLATRTDLFPEILHYLSSDPDPRVRREIAGNVATLQRANLLLAQDKDEDVRATLASKVCNFLPGLNADEQHQVYTDTLEILEILSRDQVVRIRRMIAEALKEVATAPPEVIKRLAQDSDLTVAGPVLQSSPVLTDDDLVMIIHNGPIKGALGAISKRTPVREKVSDAIIASHDVEAIAVLLGNHSAQIREQTLDFLLDRAARIPAWHEPLVRRPQLPPAAALRLATFVAVDLLDSLRGRTDLSPEAVDAVGRIVHKRLHAFEMKKAAAAEAHAARKSLMASLEVAEAMYKAGSLSESVFLSAVSSGNHDFAIASLVVRSGFSLGIVKKILTDKDPLTVVALTWKAGFTGACAEAVQSKLAKIAPTDLLIMEKGGIYSLSAREMFNALEVFTIR